MLEIELIDIRSSLYRGLLLGIQTQSNTQHLGYRRRHTKLETLHSSEGMLKGAYREGALMRLAVEAH
jgi:hypothetical protein